MSVIDTETAGLACSTNKTVHELVENYCSNERHTLLKRFNITGPLTLEEVYKSEIAGKFGCYILYDNDRLVLYVGASEKSLISRIEKHLSDTKKASEFWNRLPPPCYVDLIEVWHKWEALALESYLNHNTTNLWAHRNSVIGNENNLTTSGKIKEIYNQRFPLSQSFGPPA